MGFKFTTIEECQEKINRMRIILEEFSELNNIQFPLEFDSSKKQFKHYCVNHIYEDLKDLNYHINQLQEELDRYKKVLMEEA